MPSGRQEAIEIDASICKCLLSRLLILSRVPLSEFPLFQKLKKNSNKRHLRETRRRKRWRSVLQKSSRESMPKNMKIRQQTVEGSGGEVGG